MTENVHVAAKIASGFLFIIMSLKRAHFGVANKSRLVHSFVATPANVHDSRVLPELLHGDETRVWGDSAYRGQTAVIREKAPCAAGFTQPHSSRAKNLSKQQRKSNRTKSRTDRAPRTARKARNHAKTGRSGPTNLNATTFIRESLGVRYAMNGGVRIAYEVIGSGPPLVLVHANPFDRRMWLYQVAQYAPAFRTIAIDLRGYGESDKPNGTFTLRDMADDVVAVCRREHVARATFMGASVARPSPYSSLSKTSTS